MDDPVARMNKRLGIKNKPERPLLKKIRNYTLGTLAAATVIGGGATYFFGMDYLTKIQTHPLDMVV